MNKYTEHEEEWREEEAEKRYNERYIRRPHHHCDPDYGGEEDEHNDA